MSEVSKGKILLAIRDGANYFTEIEKKSGVSSAILGKHLKDLERAGLITVLLDRSSGRVRPIYQLNESRMDEINKLIEAYLKHEEKEFEEKMKITRNHIPPEKKIELVSYFLSLDEEKKKIIEKWLKELEEKK